MSTKVDKKAKEWAKLIWKYHHMNHKLKKADLIVVMGSKDISVAKRGAEIFLEGLAPYILFSGGLTRFKDSEAKVFSDLAVQMGVSKDRIILEDKSRNTGENVLLTKRVLKKRKLKVKNLILVQQPYMERRAYATIKKLWRTINVVVTSPEISFEKNINDGVVTPKEHIDYIVGYLQRIDRYPEMGFQSEQQIPKKVWEAYYGLLDKGFTGHLMSEIEVKEHFSLRDLNTFKVSSRTRYFSVVKSEEDVYVLLNKFSGKKVKKMVLGGGSNLLLTKDFNGLVIKNEITGKHIVRETEKSVIVEIGGGENWDKFVQWAVKNKFGGIENLALVPGTVGAAPVQNIACYGQNLVDVFVSLDAIRLSTGLKKTFTKKQCRFAYRSSIFKNELKDKYIITKVRLKLSKIPKLETSYYQIHVSYDSVKSELEKFAQKPYKISDIYKAVSRIRRRKLPDWTKEPTVGSFFINPVVSKAKLKSLQNKIQELQYYPVEELTYPQLKDPLFERKDNVKLPAGRLLDELGWRGKKIGNCWMHDKHALILVTNGKATGKEILNYAMKVREDCFDHFGINLETEVNIY